MNILLSAFVQYKIGLTRLVLQYKIQDTLSQARLVRLRSFDSNKRISIQHPLFHWVYNHSTFLYILYKVMSIRHHVNCEQTD